MVRTLLGLAFVISCSGGPGTSAPPRSPEEPRGSGSAVPPATPAATGPTERECEALIAHAVALRARELPPEQRPTDADEATLRGELRASFLPACREGSRRGYDCAVAATTLSEFSACDQRTPSSSTSNSKVAPGGILPPAAPRSP